MLRSRWDRAPSRCRARLGTTSTTYQDQLPLDECVAKRLHVPAGVSEERQCLPLHLAAAKLW
eukprot:544132-Pyramimonas_sp.AAC.1